MFAGANGLEGDGLIVGSDVQILLENFSGKFDTWQYF